VAVTIPASSLAHWDTGTPAWTIEPGRFPLAVGSSYSDERLTVEVTRATPNGSSRTDATTLRARALRSAKRSNARSTRGMLRMQVSFELGTC
jgi:hypothetical protein